MGLELTKFRTIIKSLQPSWLKVWTKKLLIQTFSLRVKCRGKWSVGQIALSERRWPGRSHWLLRITHHPLYSSNAVSHLLLCLWTRFTLTPGPSTTLSIICDGNSTLLWRQFHWYTCNLALLDQFSLSHIINSIISDLNPPINKIQTPGQVSCSEAKQD
jgi:hypothetical protein